MGLLLCGSGRAQEAIVDGKPVSVWIAMLKDSDIAIRRSAAAVLATKLTPDAKDAVLPLTEALKDSDRKVRQDVAKAIHRLGPAGDAQAVQHLMTDYQVIGHARDCARSLGELGKAASVAGPYLLVEINKNIKGVWWFTR